MPPPPARAQAQRRGCSTGRQGLLHHRFAGGVDQRHRSFFRRRQRFFIRRHLLDERQKDLVAVLLVFRRHRTSFVAFLAIIHRGGFSAVFGERRTVFIHLSIKFFLEFLEALGVFHCRCAPAAPAARCFDAKHVGNILHGHSLRFGLLLHFPVHFFQVLLLLDLPLDFLQHLLSGLFGVVKHHGHAILMIFDHLRSGGLDG